MNEAEHHALRAQRFGAVIAAVPDWDAPTPVSAWKAGDVVEHLLSWPIGVLRDWADIELTDEPSASLADRWSARSRELQSALNDPSVAGHVVADGPFAGSTAAQLVDRIYTADVFMHTWDLARAAGAAYPEDPAYATQLLNGMRQMEDVLRSSGHYGPAHPATSDDPTNQLIAFIGRDPDWTPR